jgi:uncharacterized protein YtpQ (UPF0354 family)
MSEELLSELEFTKKYVQSVTSKDRTLKVIFAKPLEVSLTTIDGEERFSYLNNAYTEYVNVPDTLQEVINRYTSSFIDSVFLSKQQYKREQIFPVIKDIQYIEQVSKLMKEKGGKIPFYFEKLNEVLFILYAFDTERNIQFLGESDIIDLSLNKVDLLNIAKENLNNSIPNVAIKGDTSSLSMVIADGNYESSFLLFDYFWTKEYFPVKGDIVVHVPSRDVLLVTGTEDPISLTTVIKMVDEMKPTRSYALADVGFVRKMANGKFIDRNSKRFNHGLIQRKRPSY